MGALWGYQANGRPEPRGAVASMGRFHSPSDSPSMLEFLHCVIPLLPNPYGFSPQPPCGDPTITPCPAGVRSEQAEQQPGAGGEGRGGESQGQTPLLGQLPTPAAAGGSKSPAGSRPVGLRLGYGQRVRRGRMEGGWVGGEGVSARGNLTLPLTNHGSWPS